MTFRTTFRETRKSRQIALIVIFREKYARRILAIVSTTSISNRPPKKSGGLCGPLSPGARLDADHPENGVLIPCRFTVRVAVRIMKFVACVATDAARMCLHPG